MRRMGGCRRSDRRTHRRRSLRYGISERQHRQASAVRGDSGRAYRVAMHDAGAVVTNKLQSATATCTEVFSRRSATALRFDCRRVVGGVFSGCSPSCVRTISAAHLAIRASSRNASRPRNTPRLSQPCFDVNSSMTSCRASVMVSGVSADAICAPPRASSSAYESRKAASDFAVALRRIAAVLEGLPTSASSVFSVIVLTKQIKSLRLCSSATTVGFALRQDSSEYPRCASQRSGRRVTRTRDLLPRSVNRRSLKAVGPRSMCFRMFVGRDHSNGWDIKHSPVLGRSDRGVRRPPPAWSGKSRCREVALTMDSLAAQRSMSNICMRRSSSPISPADARYASRRQCSARSSAFLNIGYR